MRFCFPTDVDLDAWTIIAYYRLRFGIEFIFRDAKQYTGLTHCQSRQRQRLRFHFNASLTALNIARIEQAEAKVFSIASRKRLGYNEMFLDRIIANLDLEPELVLNHPAYDQLRSYGAIAA